jgi:hypothetical protein
MTASILATAAHQAEVSGKPLPADMCQQCGGARYVIRDVAWGHPAFGKLIPCPVCRRDRQPEWLFQHSGLTQREQALSLDDWRYPEWPSELDAAALNAQRKSAYDAMRALLEARVGWLTFYGDFGAGKSHALKILACEFIRCGVEVLYGNMADILDHLRHKMFESVRGDQYWQHLLDVAVLLVDEVTNFSAKPWALEQVFRLIDLRHRRRDSHVTAFALNDDPHTMLAPGTEDNIGYLYSRMRTSPMVLLEHDVRPALG